MDGIDTNASVWLGLNGPQWVCVWLYIWGGVSAAMGAHLIMRVHGEDAKFCLKCAILHGVLWPAIVPLIVARWGLTFGWLHARLLWLRFTLYRQHGLTLKDARRIHKHYAHKEMQNAEEQARRKAAGADTTEAGHE